MEAGAKEAEKKKESKEKKRKRKKEREDGRVTKSPKKEDEQLEVGQRPLEDIFKFTGMDPDPSRRAKILKRARRLGKKGKKRSKKKEKASSSSRRSSSTSSTSSGSSDYGEEGLFEEEKRLRSIWKRCPGALAARSISVGHQQSCFAPIVYPIWAASGHARHVSQLTAREPDNLSRAGFAGSRLCGLVHGFVKPEIKIS